MKKSSKSKKPAPAFAVGDFVHFNHRDVDYYGTVRHLPGQSHLLDPTGMYYVIDVTGEAEVWEDGLGWLAQGKYLTLVLRPSVTDQAAEEYLEIIALQDLVGTDI